MLTRIATRLLLPLSVLGVMAGAVTWAAAAEAYTPPTTDAFLQSIKSYPLVASPGRRERLRVGVPQLTRCTPSADVRRLLGDPDYGYASYKGGAVSRIMWTYVLEKKALKEVDPSTRVVIWFEADGKLQAITVHGAPDIESNISRRQQVCPAT
jgi:hypothetical protein